MAEVAGTGVAVPAATLPVYNFTGQLAGAGAPAPQGGSGAASEALPVALEETFEAPPGTTDLRFSASQAGGAGSARIEVLAPDGSTAFRSLTWDGAGDPAIVYGGVAWQTEMSAESAGPGTYVVRYYVAGVRTLHLEVSAVLSMPAATPP